MNMDMVILLYIHMNMSGNMDMGPLHSSVVCDVSSSLETSTARMRRSSGSSCWRAWSTTSSGQQLTRRTDSHGVSRELPWSPHPLGKIRINQTCFFYEGHLSWSIGCAFPHHLHLRSALGPGVLRSTPGLAWSCPECRQGIYGDLRGAEFAELHQHGPLANFRNVE